MLYDERALNGLIEQSEDLQSDAMLDAQRAMPDLADYANDQRKTDTDPEERSRFIERRKVLRAGLLGAGGLALTGAFGSVLLGTLEVPAYAATSSMDVMILQTAASIENLAVATYKKALTLPYIGGSSSNAVVKTFVTTTKKQHTEHAAAFNSQISSLGGAKQTKSDPHYVPTVDKAVASLAKLSTTDALETVVGLAATLEEVAMETYVSDVTALTNSTARKLMSSIMGIEAQHVAVLLAVGALVKGGDSSLIALPPSPLTSLPAAAGSVGFPDTFIKSTLASPASQGAVS